MTTSIIINFNLNDLLSGENPGMNGGQWIYAVSPTGVSFQHPQPSNVFGQNNFS